MTSENKLPDNAPETGTYRHYKGHLYQVFGMARHSETDEWMVVYQALYGDYGFWLRPLSVWLNPIVLNSSEQLPSAAESQDTDSSDSPQQRFQLVTPAAESLTQLTKKTSARNK